MQAHHLYMRFVWSQDANPPCVSEICVVSGCKPTLCAIQENSHNTRLRQSELQTFHVLSEPAPKYHNLLTRGWFLYMGSYQKRYKTIFLRLPPRKNGIAHNVVQSCMRFMEKIVAKFSAKVMYSEVMEFIY